MIAKHLQKGEKKHVQYKELMSLLKMLVLLAVVLLLVLLSMVMKPQKQYFYAISDKSKAELPLSASEQPTLTLDYVVRWAKVAVRKAYNFDFNNHQAVLNSIKPNFTPGAYASFLNAMDASNLISTIDAKQLLMTAIVPSTPVVTYKGKLHNRFTWTMVMPLLLNFESASVPSYQEKKIIRLTVTRVPALEAPYSGIEISRFYTSGTFS